MARNNEISYKCGGTIAPASFVKLDTAAPEQVLQAGAGDATIGISQEGMKRPPGLAGSDTVIAGESGDQITVKATGNDCLLVTGTGGCTTGDYLKSDASGYGVTASSTNVVGAIALQTVTAGAKVRCIVLAPGTKMP